MVVIENGGPNGNQAVVTNVNRLQVEAEASKREFFISRDDGQVFHAISEDGTAVANEEIMYLRNTSTTKKVFVGEIIITSDINIKFRVKKVTGTAVGTDIVPENMNMTSPSAAEVEFKGDGSVTGLTDVGDIFVCRSLAGGSRLVGFGDTLILGQNDAIALETETSAAIEMTIDFHLE